MNDNESVLTSSLRKLGWLSDSALAFREVHA
jgi:hypothetical protein